MSTDVTAGKTVWYLYQARRVNTQTDGAGGALATRISMNAGQIGKMVTMFAQGTASAGSSLLIRTYDEDMAINAILANVAAGASREVTVPNIGTTGAVHQNLIDSTQLVLGPGQFITAVASAGLQNETLTVGIVLLLSTDAVPVWGTSGSVGTPSLAASTISVANTMTPVLL